MYQFSIIVDHLVYLHRSLRIHVYAAVHDFVATHIISMETVGSYRYMYVHDIPLGDFIGSTLSMAFQCIFSLPNQQLK